ncbi:MAG: hypothetical protein AAB368_04980 [bacterium]
MTRRGRGGLADPAWNRALRADARRLPRPARPGRGPGRLPPREFWRWMEFMSRLGPRRPPARRPEARIIY